MDKLKKITICTILLLSGATSALAHPGVTPYAYCAANPVKLVDPDGRDYKVTVNEENQTITISATYYTTESDAASAHEAVSRWNEQSGQYIYRASNKKDNADFKDYTVNFELKVEKVTTNREARDKVLNSQNGYTNSYRTVPDESMNIDKNGQTQNGNRINVKKSKEQGNTGAHEVGHSLGLTHTSSGLMTPSASDPWRNGGEIEGSFIMEIIENPLKGKTPKEGGISVGKGVVIHNNSIINTESYKGNIIQSIKK